MFLVAGREPGPIGFAVRGDEQKTPRLQYARQLRDPETLPGGVEMREDGECIDEVEQAARAVEAAVQPVDAERGERQVRGTPGHELGVVVGPVERRTPKGPPMAHRPAGPA